ncbi:PLP-dependent aminotransferase family protein [uncultured Ilyobacter sp.]|uniref:MocR-like pyridoxine biosynthesis transcription factor PdxR n=1 Tax=uncultured Ilyobacter sp. TaxID=544433 RepID=UPI0029C6529B|nr:PLP-dependent aminotransferase family protein [uncultured Ilyobacter sp.]
MYDFKVDKKAGNKLYIQVFEGIKKMIEDGKFERDQRLLTIRAASLNLSVNSSTIVKAYDILEKEGYLYKIVGSGCYVAAEKLPEKFHFEEEEDSGINYSQLDLEEVINFASATPSSELFPLEDFKYAINSVLERDGGEVFSYQDPKGYGPLREEISRYLSEKNIKTDNIQIVSGSQQAIDIVGKMLIKPGDKIIVEGPTYSGAVTSFKKAGAHIITIPLEKDGMDMKKLKSTLEKEREIKFIYTMMNYHNPTGICWSETKKKKLLKMAFKNNIFIVEDDCMSEIYYGDYNPLSLKSIDEKEKVIYIKSFSKIFMPGLRLAFMALPKELSETAVSVKYMADISSSGLNQRAFHYYMKKGCIYRHLDLIRKTFSQRYAVMKEEIKNIPQLKIVYEAEGGLFFWIKIPEWMDSEKFYNIALKKGVAFLPGRVFYQKNDLSPYLRISFAGVDEGEIKTGMIYFREAFEEYLGKRGVKSPLV